MLMIDPLLMEFDRECGTTRKVLARVPDDKLAWKPHVKSMSLAELAHHIATIPAWIASSLLSDGIDMAKSSGFPKPPATAAEILAEFDEGVKGAKVAMGQLDDEKAMGTWTLRKGDVVVMAIPRIAFVRMILLNHSYHHRGQLSVYLRLLDVPLPSIYGPTADENPFG
jgi:uncharacterized damage-inducible protein DinB